MAYNDNLPFCTLLGITIGLAGTATSLLLFEMSKREVDRIKQKYYGDVPYGYNVNYLSSLSSDGTVASASLASTLRYLNERQTEDIVES